MPAKMWRKGWGIVGVGLVNRWSPVVSSVPSRSRAPPKVAKKDAWSDDGALLCEHTALQFRMVCLWGQRSAV